MNKQTNIPPEEFEMLERYVLKRMSDEDHQAFTNRLTHDANLQKKLRSVRLMLTGIQEAGLSDKLDLYHQGLRNNRNRTSRGIRISLRRMMVAASVILMIGMGALWYFSQSAKPDSNVFATYYKPDPGLLTAMSATNNYTFEHAMIDYKTGAYANAIQSWQALLEQNPGNDTLNYFLGSAYLASDRARQAIRYFDVVIRQPESYFFEDACWYAGLSMLKLQKQKEAIPLIKKSGHPQREALLSELKEYAYP